MSTFSTPPLFHGEFHVDGVFADRTVLAVDLVRAIGVVASVLLLGSRGIRIVGMVLDGAVGRIGTAAPLLRLLRLLFLRLFAFTGVAGVFVVHGRGLGLAARGQQRQARRGQRNDFHRILFAGHVLPFILSAHIVCSYRLLISFSVYRFPHPTGPATASQSSEPPVLADLVGSTKSMAVSPRCAPSAVDPVKAGLPPAAS